MSRQLPTVLLIGVFALLTAATARGQEDMVANPYHKFWSNCKPGSKSLHVQKTKLGGPEGKLVPGGIDVKRITYKLIQADDDKAVVQQTVTEEDFLGYVQAAPTRYIYPAKVAKSKLERILLEAGAEAGEDTLKVGGKQLKCKTISGTVKGADGVETQFRLWLSDEVPGMIAKQVRTTRQNGELIAETTTTVQSFEHAD